MTHTKPARAAGHRRRSAILVVALVVSAAVVGVLGHPSLASWSTSASSPHPIELRPPDGPRRDGERAPDQPEVGIPDGTTVFDDNVSAVARLDPDLLRALRRAATDAAEDQVRLFVNSGWRSHEDQERLFRTAVSTYGSEEEAARWVARPGTSAHESGQAVDLGPSRATTWLSRHGAGYGLCQIYGNEPWHYELRPDAVDHGCPPRYADATHDPRTQR